MSKICRTCLQKTNQTFTTNQILGNFDGGAVKISLVLRFCIPELYLGLSSNPEICYSCREDLRVAYLFKKKCLNTENIIGNFLKNLRCTARSVELHDVVSYLDDSVKAQLEQERAKAKIIVNAQDILSEWEEQPDDEVVSSESTLEVQQAAPNPTVSVNTSNRLKFCDQTGLFVNPQGRSFEFKDNSVSEYKESQKEPDAVKHHQEGENLTTQQHKDIASPQIENVLTQAVETTECSPDNFFKITSVYSLSETAANTNTDHDNANEVDCVNDKNSENIIGDNNTDRVTDTVDIKSEPLDVEINSDRAGFNYTPTDEETLDASETASYEGLHPDANLQGIIDNIPEINEDNQYVDVPEFVHINNFGLKDLEELRRQQIKDTDEDKKEEENTILNFENKIPTPNNMFGSFDLTKKDSRPEESKNGNVVVKSSINLPDTLFLNGKKMVKCRGGYRVVEDPSPLLKSILNSEQVVATQATVEPQETSKYIKPVTFDEKAFKKIPEVIFIEGKRYFKANENKGFKIVSKPEDGTELVQIKATATGKVQNSQKCSLLPAFPNADQGSNMGFKSESSFDNADSEVIDSKPNVIETVDSGPTMRRRRKRLKIVPVNDIKSLTKRRVSIVPKLSDKDIVVLFTNYTMDGFYINDHDYLVNPYKRNKVLLEEENEWMCMCYICHTKHEVYNHIHHMVEHGKVCKVCRLDLGSPYMLNVHVRGHNKPCRICTERVPYGLMETHEQNHLEEEVKFDKDSDKMGPYRKKRIRREEKPIYFRIQQPNPPQDASSEEMNESSLGNVTTEEVKRSTEKKQKGRKRKNTNENSPTVEKSFRVLRSNARKSYNEADDFDNVKVNDVVEDT